MKRIKVTCPLDCFDTCGLIATVENGCVIRVEGDKEHPLTQGYICRKGRDLVTRHNHSNRLKHALLKTPSGRKKISIDQAIALLADKLTDAKETFGSLSVLNYPGGGYGGISKTSDETFFNCFGGVTVPRGSLCWAAGIMASKLDFGEPRGHHPADILNSQVIILWGRNPHATNIHLSGYLKKTSDKGARIILIDPLVSETASSAHIHLAVNPSTDGLLAMSMANHIMANGLHDASYIRKHVMGYGRYRAAIKPYTPEFAAGITGITADTIRALAEIYASGNPSSIVIGYGMQRYRNGGNNVRAINALGAITGNIGKNGGGVTYATRNIKNYIRPHAETSLLDVKHHRSFSVTQFGRFLEEADNPPVKVAIVSKANPLVQSPDVSLTRKAFRGIDFTVVMDHFMTDTAACADLVIPVTTVFEEHDLFFNSMYSPYLSYSEKAVEPPEGVIGEFDLYNRLAKTMGVACYPQLDRNTFFSKALSLLTERYGVTLETLKKGYFSIPGSEVPWKDEHFLTPSGKYELWSETAKNLGLSPLPEYLPPLKHPKGFPLRLITPHKKNSLHSQHFAFREDLPQAGLNPQTLKQYGIENNAEVYLESPLGRIRVLVTEQKGVPEGIVKLFEGWWHKSGAVNLLIPDHESDMGEQAALYDSFCRIVVV